MKVYKGNDWESMNPGLETCLTITFKWRLSRRFMEAMVDYRRLYYV